MLKTMVLCLLSFLFGVYTGRIFWRKSNGCDEQLLEPLTFLSPSHACIEAEHVTSGSKWCHLLLCEGACECPKKPTEGDLFASGMAILFSLVFPSSLGQGFCLFVSASEGCRQLLESLACSHLPYSEAELHKLSKLPRCADWSFLVIFVFLVFAGTFRNTIGNSTWFQTYLTGQQTNARTHAGLGFLYIPRVSLRLQL